MLCVFHIKVSSGKIFSSFSAYTILTVQNNKSKLQLPKTISDFPGGGLGEDWCFHPPPPSPPLPLKPGAPAPLLPGFALRPECWEEQKAFVLWFSDRPDSHRVLPCWRAWAGGPPVRKGRSFSHPISPAISCTSHPRTTKGHNVLASKLSAEGLGGRARADWLLHRRAPGCTATRSLRGGHTEEDHLRRGPASPLR